MDKRISLLPIVFIVFAVAFAAAVGISAPALAAGEPVVPTFTATAVTDATLINGGDGLSVTRGAYDGINYAKDIEIEFDLKGAPRYRIDVRTDGGEWISGTPVATTTPTVTYSVIQSGTVEVRCVVFDAGGTTIGDTVATVYSDLEIDSIPEKTPMPEWVALGSAYDFTVTMTDFKDNKSGVGEVWYRLDTVAGARGALTGVSLSDNALLVTVTEPSILRVYYLDRAYNLRGEIYNLDKFDGVKPATPAITATPNVTDANGYAMYYTVEIDYGYDEDSGLADTFYYILNGVRHEYIGAFELREPLEYSIRASVADRVGNYSATAEKTVKANTFDVTPPTVLNIRTEVDLRNEKTHTIRFVATDSESKVKYAYVKDTDYVFQASAEQTYVLSLDALELGGLTVLTVDCAGNVAQNGLVFNRFDGVTDMLRELPTVYAELKSNDFADYNAAAKQTIESKYDYLNALLMSDLTVQADIVKGIEDLYAVIDGSYRFVYAIESTPVYLLGGLTFEPDIADFAGYKKGDEIKLVFKRADAGTNYASAVGFKKGFCDFFTLTPYINGEPVGELANGIKISLNMPAGYYERDYALVDTASGEKQEIKCINNKIEFVLKKPTTYALVIGGDTATAQDAQKPIKTVTVFGHKLSYGAFFGTVFGVIGGVAIIVAVLIIVAKKRSRG